MICLKKKLVKKSLLGFASVVGPSLSLSRSFLLCWHVEKLEALGESYLRQIIFT